jgi:hypothetical protein
MPSTRSTRLIVVAALLACASAGAETVVLTPLKDNTLIQIANGSLSQGSSEYFYVGRVGSMGGGTIRRGVIAFDVAGSVPAGSTVASAVLKLQMNLTNTGAQTIRLKRMLEDWGEGASVGFGGQGVPAERGDATWLHQFYPADLWTTPGGVFTSTISAQLTVNQSGTYLFGTTAQMTADVQGWVDDAATNFGWLVQGNESATQTMKQFGAKENKFRPFVPTLTITYTPPKLGDLNLDRAVDGADLGILLAAWGACVVDQPCTGDLNDDDVIDGADLGVLLAAWTG